MTTTPIIVTLDTPLKRGDTEITSIELRKPDSGALRGTTLQALVNLDVDALAKVLPRITTPTLTTPEILKLDPADLVQLGTEFVFFLTPKSVLAGAKEDYPTT